MEEAAVSVEDFAFGVAGEHLEGESAVDDGEVGDFGVAEDEGGSVVDGSEFVGWVWTLADVDLRSRFSWS